MFSKLNNPLLLHTIIWFIVVLLSGCQSSVRFSSEVDISNKNSRNTDKTSTAHNTTSNTSSNDKNRNSEHFDKKAKVIYPQTNKYSKQIISISEKWLGVKYLYGGNTKAGVDCSGFVKNVFSELGFNLPRSSAEQFTYLKPTKVPAVGDLVFFQKNGRINHVGIFIGDDEIIHSSSGKGVVKQKMKGTSLERTFAGYRKVF